MEVKILWVDTANGRRYALRVTGANGVAVELKTLYRTEADAAAAKRKLLRPLRPS